jgi:hypothetical protein
MKTRAPTPSSDPLLVASELVVEIGNQLVALGGNADAKPSDLESARVRLKVAQRLLTQIVEPRRRLHAKASPAPVAAPLPARAASVEEEPLARVGDTADPYGGLSYTGPAGDVDHDQDDPEGRAWSESHGRFVEDDELAAWRRR